MSVEKKLKKMTSFMDKNFYASATALLNSDKVIQYIRDFIYMDMDNLSKTEEQILLDNIEVISKVSKALYDINWTKGSLIFKLLPDEIYDSMLEKYKVIRGQEPFQSHIPTGMRDKRHDFPELVGTLDKAYEVRDTSDKTSVEKFLRKISQKYNVEKFLLDIALKYDGSSMSTTMQKDPKGRYYPVSATSRGDFDDGVGVDMTNLILYREPIDIKNLIDLPDKFGVQYEAMITEKGKKKLSKITGIDYKTRRAAIAAAIKRCVTLDPESPELREISECISLVPINISENLIEAADGDWEVAMQWAREKFVYGDINSECETRPLIGDTDQVLDKFQSLVLEYTEKRKSLPYSIDGLVITIVDPELRDKLGRTNNINRWQIAYKFNALVQRTIVTGILTTQGRQGFLGHNILFEPIEFNGVVYDKAPVNNITRFNGLDLRIGDEVLVSYNADVMGYIYKDDSCRPNKDGKKIKLPTVCINCGEPLTTVKDMLKCENEDCSGQAIGRILEAIRIFNIDFFGEETAQALVDVGIVNAIDFIQMSRETLAKVLKGKNLEKAWDEFSEKVNSEIDYSKVIDLLRIPSLRTKTAKKLISHIGMDKIYNLMTDAKRTGTLRYMIGEFKRVPGVNKNAEVFAQGLLDKSDELQKLTALLKVTEVKEPEYSKVILVSGFRNNAEFEAICKKMNYGITDSGKYDILVVTQDRLEGSKAKAARKSGKPIYTLPEFIEKYS